MKYDITNFNDLFNEIIWSWDSDHTKFISYGDGAYNLNKLSITKTHMEYKGHYSTISPEVYHKFLTLVNFMDEVLE